MAGGMTVAATAEGTSAAVGGVMGVVTAIKKKILKVKNVLILLKLLADITT